MGAHFIFDLEVVAAAVMAAGTMTAARAVSSATVLFGGPGSFRGVVGLVKASWFMAAERMETAGVLRTGFGEVATRGVGARLGIGARLGVGLGIRVLTVGVELGRRLAKGLLARIGRSGTGGVG